MVSISGYEFRWSGSLLGASDAYLPGIVDSPRTAVAATPGHLNTILDAQT